MIRIYVIIVYDVKSERNREVITFLREHLHWIQNSVFEGDLTEAEYRKVKDNLSGITDEGDSIVVYSFRSSKYVDKDTIGEEKGSSERII